jgi:hypothetical protein
VAAAAAEAATFLGAFNWFRGGGISTARGQCAGRGVGSSGRCTMAGRFVIFPFALLRAVSYGPAVLIVSNISMPFLALHSAASNSLTRMQSSRCSPILPTRTIHMLLEWKVRHLDLSAFRCGVGAVGPSRRQLKFLCFLFPLH